MRAAILATAIALTACGVPKDQHDAAVAERDRKVAEQQKELDDLKARLADAEGKAADEQTRAKQAAADGKAESDQTRAELEELRKQKAASEARLRLLEDFLAKFKTMIDAGKLDITVRRGQIVLALGTDILFDTGRTEIKAEGKTALAEVAAALRGVTGRRFQVGGHTDNFPIKTKEFPSNWELSTARAVEVTKFLVEKGVKPDALSAAGYAEFDPSQPNTTDKGRAKNRRIEIILVPNVEDLVKMPELGTKSKDPSKVPGPKK